MRVWRICDERHASTAFSGEGAQLYGARWNPAGTPMVYTACSFPLAILELFVNLDSQSDPGTLVSLEAVLPVNVEAVERVEVASLSADWKRIRNEELQEMGAAWVLSRRSLVLLVPSAVADGEWNALVNPLHPDAGKITVGAPKPFRFDPRMFRR
jgi:RES domain-containing protein